MASRSKVEADFNHYIGKLAKLRANLKTDPKQLERNQHKCDPDSNPNTDLDPYLYLPTTPVPNFTSLLLR